jgi:hypothetical protein
VLGDFAHHSAAEAAQVLLGRLAAAQSAAFKRFSAENKSI